MRIFCMITTSSSHHYTAHAVRSFFQTTELMASDLFLLIDNDGDFDRSCIEEFKDVTLLPNKAPLGFAENSNKALQIALNSRSDAYLLNNDIILSPGWIESLSCTKSAIIAPLSNREIEYNTDVFCTKVEMQLEDYLGNEAGYKRLCQFHRQNNPGFGRLLVLPFFCVKIPHQIIESVGMLDTSFGAGGAEDYDYCLRAIQEGFHIINSLDSYVLHFGGKSSWSGAESKSQQLLRESKFKQVFRKKWGAQLTRIILEPEAQHHKEIEGLEELINAGKYTELVERLKPVRPAKSRQDLANLNSR